MVTRNGISDEEYKKLMAKGMAFTLTDTEKADKPDMNKRGFYSHLKIESGVRLILEGMGYQIEGDLVETPTRVAKAYFELCQQENFNLTDFDDGGYDGMVFQGPLYFHSLCRHHMLPFFGKAWIAYLPKDNKVVGLSKLARTVDFWSRGLQTQEYITTNIAEFLSTQLGAQGVAVRLRAVHTCMEIRGAKKNGAYTTTQSVLGVFRTDPSLKQEFIEMVHDNP